jgi:F-type H+-transporting ATPase subunit b
MELLANLGINWKLLIAQIVNFLILLFVLYKFAYTPVLKVLNDRTKKIEDGIKNAEDAKNKLIELSAREKDVLSKARKEAQEIIKKSEENALKNAKTIEDSAKNQYGKILEEVKAQIEQEKNKAVKEAKLEIAELIVSATEKIIDEKMDAKKDKELINKAIE